MGQTKEKAVQRRGGVYSMVMVAIMAAILCVVSPWTLPIGPIPISLCTFIIMLTVYVLGWKRGTTAVLVYILLGAVGMPVFSNFGGGLAKVLAPTGGYIVGYLPLALIAGIFIDRFPKNRGMQLMGMVLGTGVLYTLGTAWYCVQSGTELVVALGWCVFPFLPGDVGKIVVCLVMGPMLRTQLTKAGVYKD